jgi:hypothetical protein
MACDEPCECKPGYVRECNHDICDGEYEYCISGSKQKGCDRK